MPNWSSNASREMLCLGGACASPFRDASLTSVTVHRTSHGARICSQDVFLRFYRTLGSYRSAHGGFATWMIAVTRILLIDHYRRTKPSAYGLLDDAIPVVENKQSSARAR